MGARYLYSGDSAITVEFGDEISESISKRVIGMKKAIEDESLYGVQEIVTTYRSLLLYFNPYDIDSRTLIEKLKDLESRLRVEKNLNKRTIEIPVCYDLQYGLDLERVAQSNGLSVEELIAKHISKEYLVYMVGFTPGFPYMGKLCPELVSPRRDSPRLLVEKGSVAIAGEQTGIYPLDSPGGWNVIGRTPVELYNASWSLPTLLEAGDYVKFTRVDDLEFKRIAELAKDGLYSCKIRLSRE